MYIPGNVQNKHRGTIGKGYVIQALMLGSGKHVQNKTDEDMSGQSSLALKITMFLPLYIDLGKLKRIVGPKDKGYTLAIWNCGDGTNLRTILRDMRITIRKDGLYWKTIKHGYV